MSQDPVVASTNGKAEVDIDDIEVEVLIIAKNPTALKATCAYLNRRGWPSECLGNISKAIERMADKKPDFVMVSFNHPSPSVISLPELVEQTFKIPCIAFVEAGDSASAQRLNKAKATHKIFGQPSGPNFQRGIRRILAEKFNVKVDDGSGPEAAKTKDSNKGNMTIRGSGPKDVGSTVISNKESSGSNYNQQGQDSGTGYNGAQSGANKGVNVHDGGAQSELMGGNAPSAPSDRAAGSSLQKKLGSGINADSGGGPNLKAKDNSGRKRKKLKQVTGETSENAPELAPVKSDLVGMLKKSLFGETGEEVVEKTARSILEKAVESAMDQVCIRDSDVQMLSLGKIERVAVFPVDSIELSGYVIVAMPTEPTEDPQTFLKNCDQSLHRNFVEMTVPANLERGFWLSLPEVDFDQWATKASFNFKVDHYGIELGIAFFSSQGPLPKPRQTREKGMHTIDLDHISTEQPINFKAYLHLFQNKKYFLYVRNGRQLQPEQKKRLKGKKVNDLFMKSADVEKLRHFLAAVFLQESIKTAKGAA